MPSPATVLPNNSVAPFVSVPCGVNVCLYSQLGIVPPGFIAFHVVRPADASVFAAGNTALVTGATAIGARVEPIPAVTNLDISFASPCIPGFVCPFAPTFSNAHCLRFCSVLPTGI
jgi:hypothetical protein